MSKVKDEAKKSKGSKDKRDKNNADNISPRSRQMSNAKEREAQVGSSESDEGRVRVCIIVRLCDGLGLPRQSGSSLIQTAQRTRVRIPCVGLHVNAGRKEVRRKEYSFELDPCVIDWCCQTLDKRTSQLCSALTLTAQTHTWRVCTASREARQILMICVPA